MKVELFCALIVSKVFVPSFNDFSLSQLLYHKTLILLRCNQTFLNKEKTAFQRSSFLVVNNYFLKPKSTMSLR